MEWRITVALAGALLLACTDSEGPQDPDDAGDAGGIVPPVELSWRDVRETVVVPRCTGPACHNADAGLSLFKYSFVVNAPARAEPCEGRTIAVPFDPERSLLYKKLTSDPLCGSRMPFSLEPLPSDMREMVRLWIEAGAPP